MRDRRRRIAAESDTRTPRDNGTHGGSVFINRTDMCKCIVSARVLELMENAISAATQEIFPCTAIHLA